MAKPKGTVITWDFGEDRVPISKIVAAARKYPKHKLFTTNEDAVLLVFARNKKDAQKMAHDEGAEHQPRVRKWNNNDG